MPLTLEDALARVPLWQGRADLTVEPLSGGITNRNYRVQAGAQAYVLRLSGDNTDRLGIDRRNEHAAALAAAQAGVGPAVVAFIEPEGCLVTAYVQGRPVPPDEMRQPATIAEAAAALRRVHSLPPIPGWFSPFQVVAGYTALARERGVAAFPADFEWILAQVRAVEAAFGRAPAPPCPCHNDLLNENFLREAGTGRLVILDWEYAGMGDPHFDLANLAAHHDFGDAEDEQLLRGYFGEAAPERLARHHLMKRLSDLREAMWGVAQLGLSSLDFDFRGYADKFFARVTAGFRDPRCAGWLAALHT